MPNLFESTADGLYCPAGDFYVDPWGPVARAVVTHSHSDHARPGSGTYLTAADGARILRLRLGSDASIDALAFGETRTINSVSVSLHPAGHVLGSAQVRVEHRGEVWVVSGDYKLASDPTCTAFEPQRCHTFITESTFGLPIYRWADPAAVFAEINSWWRRNQEAGKASLLYGHTLGKAQRLLAGVDPCIGPIFAHGAVRNVNRCYRESGVAIPDAASVEEAGKGYDWSRALIIGPTWAHATPWIRRFGSISTAFASGWMRIRGTRRRRAIDRGFVLSDHADWPGLLEAIRFTEAESVWVTHGYRSTLVHWLTEHGKQANVVETRWEEGDDDGDDKSALETPVNLAGSPE